MVAPELEKWVASQLAEEAAILKERRKGSMNWWQPPLIHVARTITSPSERGCLEAVACSLRGSFVVTSGIEP